MREKIKNEAGMYRLLASIIKANLYDLLRDTSNIKDEDYKIRCEQRRKQAEIWFTKSRLFILTGLDLEYLIDNYKRGNKWLEQN